MTLPKSTAEPERYVGRPLLMVLESYVLAALGLLSPEQDAVLRSVVKRAYGGDDDWMATVRGQLDLGPSLDDRLRAMWARNTDAPGDPLTAFQFAKLMVDTSFALLKVPPGGEPGANG